MASLRGWLAAAHPFPLALVLALTALVGIASTDGELDEGRLALALVAMALSQLAIGWSNDYLDRETDAAQQPWKPVPSGLVRAELMPPAIGAVLVGSLAVGALLGLTPLLLLVAGTACGLAYNLGLKDTRLSAVPFVVALALLPAYVWASLDVYRDGFLWLYAVGTPPALAAHLANTIPDIEGDAAAGRGGLAVRLGRRGSVVTVGVCLLLGLVIAFVAQDGGESLRDEVLVGALCGVLGVAGLAAYVPGTRRGDVWAFRLVAVAGVVLATGWLATA
jgi:4-hydroxybenzoate polyprenyltransferase